MSSYCSAWKQHCVQCTFSQRPRFSRLLCILRTGWLVIKQVLVEIISFCFRNRLNAVHCCTKRTCAFWQTDYVLCDGVSRCSGWNTAGRRCRRLEHVSQLGRLDHASARLICWVHQFFNLKPLSINRFNLYNNTAQHNSVIGVSRLYCLEMHTVQSGELIYTFLFSKPV